MLDGADDAELFAAGGGRAEPAPWAADEDATCSINYTSGTTARPKGVQLTHRNCWLNATTFGWHTTVSATRRVPAHAAHVPLQRLGHALRRHGHGRRHVVLRKIDGEEILRADRGRGRDPAVRGAGGGGRRPGRRRRPPEPGRPCPAAGRVRIVVAGAPPPSKTIERVETELGWEFIQIYGLTETAPLLTVNRARPSGTASTPPSGRACWPGRRPGRRACSIRIDDEGEILARSNHVFAGYWQQPEDTAAALAGGWFHTGDGGHLDGPYTVISDRKKDVIITGGENVSSIEVEDCLYQHPAVAEAAVIGVPDDKWGETVKALVVLGHGRGHRGRAHRALPGPHGPLQGTHPVELAPRWCARPPASSRSTSSASPTGRVAGGVPSTDRDLAGRPATRRS